MAVRYGRRRALPLAAVAAAAALAAVLAGCSSSSSSSHSAAAAAGPGDGTATVTVSLTPQGCAPQPAKVSAGAVDFNVDNKNADSVSEAELRTSDLSKILGEQENLTPGLSGGFSLNLPPGTYKISCPGASQQDWTFTVTGKAAGQSWQSVSQLASAVSVYGMYITRNTSRLVTSSQKFCQAINAGNMAQAKVLYPQARVYYERIEPVAEVWGTLDTSIDGRWENPVTVASQFTGFHKLEQLLWEDNTLKGAPQLCAGLVKNEQRLLTLVKSAQYNPLEMASGSTDLLNEAAANKISGEEERYSNTDLPVFKANVDGAMEVVSLFTPYLRQKDPSLLSAINQRNAAVTKVLGTLKSSPGYDGTGYVEYSTVLDDQRKQLSTTVNALSEELSKLSLQVSG
ncbi:MAG TPA: iron uptake system protein EfeO [Trebonia sp.]